MDKPHLLDLWNYARQGGTVRPRCLKKCGALDAVITYINLFSRKL